MINIVIGEHKFGSAIISYQANNFSVSFGDFIGIRLFWNGMEFYLTLGEHADSEARNDDLKKLVNQAKSGNKWADEEMYRFAITLILENMTEDVLSNIIQKSIEKGKDILKEEYRRWRISNPLGGTWTSF